MKQSTLTKIEKSELFNDESFSKGFRRWKCLPKRIQKDLGLSYLLRTGKADCHNFIVEFFQYMSISEYEQYVLTH